MGAKLLLVIVAILAWSESINLHGIKSNNDQRQEVSCDGDDCVDTMIDHKDSDVVNNDRTKRSITCTEAGGKCIPTKKQEKCKKTIITKLTCSKKKVCCIKEVPTTTVTPTTTTSKPIDGDIEIKLEELESKMDTMTNMLEYIVSRLPVPPTTQSTEPPTTPQPPTTTQSTAPLTTEVPPTTVTPTTTTSKPIDEVVNQCLKTGTNQSVILQTLNNVDHDIEFKLQGVQSKIINNITQLQGDTDSSINSLSTQQQTMNTNILNKLQEMERKLDVMTFTLRCSVVKGFLTPSQDECFVYNFDVARTWETARTYCSGLGLRIASPKNGNAIWLRKFIVETFGRGYTWVGGRGDGSALVMNGETIPASSPLWGPGEPGSSVTTSHCLILFTHAWYMTNHPDQPYYSVPCSRTYRTLCELV